MLGIRWVKELTTYASAAQNSGVAQKVRGFAKIGHGVLVGG
jgi:hypothetical protein